jgi:hypothetical protein
MLTVQTRICAACTKITMDSGDPRFTKPDLKDNRGIQPVAVGPVKILVEVTVKSARGVQAPSPKENAFPQFTNRHWIGNDKSE